jgi:hypothetical protein
MRAVGCRALTDVLNLTASTAAIRLPTPGTAPAPSSGPSDARSSGALPLAGAAGESVTPAPPLMACGPAHSCERPYAAAPTAIAPLPMPKAA